MQKYEVGSVLPGYVRRGECTSFGMTGSGLDSVVAFSNPSETERISISEGKFEIRLLELQGIIFVLLKFGNLSWMDAPYSPHLSADLSLMDIVPSGNLGYSLTVHLVDEGTGIIKAIRLLGLGTRFCQTLRDMAMRCKTMDFYPAEYQDKINRIYATYSTKQMVKMSTTYYKI